MLKIGQAMGLAWTPSGSSLIQVKTKIRKGAGTLLIEGDIGASFYLAMKDIPALLELHSGLDISKFNIRLTIPSPIDGPSAALAVFMSMHSALTKSPVSQRKAFVGELSRNGDILPVGEISSKLEVAERAQLDMVFLPPDNLTELTSDSKYKPGYLTLVPAKTIKEILNYY